MSCGSLCVCFVADTVLSRVMDSPPSPSPPPTRTQRYCWKNKLEALRKNSKVSGYEWWLLQDFWMGGNGVLDTYYASKHPPEEMQQVANLNAGVQVLVAEPGDLIDSLTDVRTEPDILFLKKSSH